ncbi:MAG: hypothetical protein QGD94_06640, partial [Planctomycetia bacterium]|nr:hypothetical protein [Planctomycetia bacterium]
HPHARDGPLAPPKGPAGRCYQMMLATFGVSPMSRKRKILAVACVTMATLVSVVAFMLATPSIPEECKHLRPGMSREEVLRIVPDEVHDMRDLKGFDRFIRKYRKIVRPCWWTLFVVYDERGRVSSISADFIDPNCGLFNDMVKLAGE